LAYPIGDGRRRSGRGINQQATASLLKKSNADAISVLIGQATAQPKPFKRKHNIGRQQSI
jgi:hypothetical protein